MLGSFLSNAIGNAFICPSQVMSYRVSWFSIISQSEKDTQFYKLQEYVYF